MDAVAILKALRPDEPQGEYAYFLLRFGLFLRDRPEDRVAEVCESLIKRYEMQNVLVPLVPE